MTAEVFDATCREFEATYVDRLTLTSGIRSTDHNQAVGGVATSKHLIGMARDYVVESKESGWTVEALEGLETILADLFPSFKLYHLGASVGRPTIQIHVQGAPYAP